MNNQDDNYLAHHGVEGMKWGVRHDPERKGYGDRRHHNQKGQPPLSQREIAKRERAIYKKKKLPKTSLGLLLRNRNLSEAEYRQAKKKIERDRDVYEGFLRDIQNIQRTLDIPVNALNSGVKTVKNIDYINTLFGGTSFTDRKPSTRNNKWKKKFDSELKIVHSDTEDIDNFLCHFGILGQKWGKRNGPPYPLEEKKKSWSERRQEKKEAKKAKKKEEWEAAKKVVEEAKKAKASKEDGYDYPGYSGKKLKSIDAIDRNDLINTQNGNFKKVNDDIMKNPEKLAAAILGTKAILSSRYKEGPEYHTNITKGDLDWFLWEDQTIGLQPIAHLVQKGATKNQIIQFLDKEVKAYDNGMDDGISFGAVESWVGSYSKKDTEKFIDECYKIRDGKLEHSDTITIPSLQHDDMKDVDNYLCHYGVIGMKWGVRNAREASDMFHQTESYTRKKVLDDLLRSRKISRQQYAGALARSKFTLKNALKANKAGEKQALNELKKSGKTGKQHVADTLNQLEAKRKGFNDVRNANLAMKAGAMSGGLAGALGAAAAGGKHYKKVYDNYYNNNRSAIEMELLEDIKKFSH